MARKKHTPQEETPELLKSREKRKWQIALRRYVLEKTPSVAYAPFFGLDNEKMRQWFESQFTEGKGWVSFGINWQFGHIIPVNYFDCFNEEDLKLCWNFINIRVEHINPEGEKGGHPDILTAKNYFSSLLEQTGYPLCKLYLDKINKIEHEEKIATAAQEGFIRNNQAYLNTVSEFSSYAFELLNSGKSPEEVKKDISLLKNLEK